MKITPELERRIGNAIKYYECDTCEGKGYVNGSPSDPTPNPCEDCHYTGFNSSDGETLNDVKDTVIATINDYVKEFANG